MAHRLAGAGPSSSQGKSPWETAWEALQRKRTRLAEVLEEADQARREVEEAEEEERRTMSEERAEELRMLAVKDGWEHMVNAMGGFPWNGDWYEEDENGGGLIERHLDGYLWLGEPQSQIWVGVGALPPRYGFREGWVQEDLFHDPTWAFGRSPWKFVSGWFPMPSEIPVRWRPKEAAMEPEEGVVISPPWKRPRLRAPSGRVIPSTWGGGRLASLRLRGVPTGGPPSTPSPIPFPPLPPSPFSIPYQGPPSP